MFVNVIFMRFCGAYKNIYKSVAPFAIYEDLMTEQTLKKQINNHDFHLLTILAIQGALRVQHSREIQETITLLYIRIQIIVTIKGFQAKCIFYTLRPA